jgi:hypothetical protein
MAGLGPWPSRGGGLSGVRPFYSTLILLGLGWNFGFIGATDADLGLMRRPSGGACRDERRIVMGCVTLARWPPGA